MKYLGSHGFEQLQQPLFLSLRPGLLSGTIRVHFGPQVGAATPTIALSFLSLFILYGVCICGVERQTE